MPSPATDYLAQQMSEQAYLDSEPYTEVKREYIEGYVYAMAGAHRDHNRIASTLSRKMGNHLEGNTCEVFQSDMRVKVGSNYFYPDILVDCSGTENYWTTTPSLIIEVLSNSTRRLDETTKRVAYLQIPSLQEYVLIEYGFAKIEVMRRRDNWQHEYYYLGDEITFHAIGLTLTVEEIYERVQNEDVLAWLTRKSLDTNAPKTAGE